MRIYLIGFMGAGKSTLGPILAKKLGYSCIESDVLVEKLAGISIPEIFRLYGEIRFRELERQVLFFTQLCYDTVICTGGGTPCFSGNMEWMKQQGITVYLSCDEEIIMQRLNLPQKDRPLFNDQNSWKNLLHSRIETYQKAHIQLVNHDLPENSVESLLMSLEKWKK